MQSVTGPPDAVVAGVKADHRIESGRRRLITVDKNASAQRVTKRNRGGFNISPTKISANLQRAQKITIYQVLCSTILTKLSISTECTIVYYNNAKSNSENNDSIDTSA